MKYCLDSVRRLLARAEFSSQQLRRRASSAQLANFRATRPLRSADAAKWAANKSGRRRRRRRSSLKLKLGLETLLLPAGATRRPTRSSGSHMF